MTSEGTHHPGQQPDEVSPGAGGPAPYGDRPAPQDNGYGAGAPDLGWAPPPPSGRPNPPAWGAQGEQQQAPAWATPAPQQTDPAQPGQWGPAGGSPQPAWPGAQEQPGPAWAAAAPPPPHATPQPPHATPEQPAWASAEQASPAWAQPEPAARGAARVPQAAPAPQPWPAQDDPNRSGGWNAESPQDPANGWNPGQQQDDPNRSGGEQQQGEQPGWDAGAEQRPAGAWAASRDDAPRDDQPQGGEWPARDERSARGAASVPSQPDERDANGWGAAQPTSTPPGRASVSAPGDGGPKPWGPAAENPPQWAGNAAERPAVPDVEPWSADEAWGRAEAGEPAPGRAGNGWEPERAEEPPIYQPPPGPGISPANAVPLPPQEQRVPGASLAAAPPVDYTPPAQFAPEQPGRDGGLPAYEQEQPAWAQAGSRHDEPQSPAGPVVPAPRTSPEAGGRAAVPSPGGAEPAAGSVSASASVPLASRVLPPTDQALRPAGTPAPQPRVYGRPARPEPADEPEQDDPSGHRPDHAPAPRFDQGPDPRFGQEPDPRFGQEPDPRFGQEPRFGQGQAHQFDQGPEARFDDRAPSGTAVFGAVAPMAPASPAAPPAFPPGVPSFVDAPASNRPVNGVRPHDDADRPADPFGTPAAAGAAPGYGPAPTTEHAPGGAFPPAFPPPPQQSGPSWDQGGSEQDQNRFDSFKPIAEPKTEAPTPKVRNGRVLAAVLVAAVLILAVPLGLLMLLGKVGGEDKAPAFDPAVGSCVKKSGESAAAAQCGEAGAFTVVSKVDAKDKCADPTQPHIVLQGGGTNRVLCLKPAGQ
ncbi:LppU/SCO3897 family protein [Micromonospora sp. URMC 107]|uniref:LppU/SCO3897 family protein n=1 Tax=Micromonospora sp. URMC 107 TaxID=3423418 RepID=UPI003F1C1661